MEELIQKAMEARKRPMRRTRFYGRSGTAMCRRHGVYRM